MDIYDYNKFKESDLSRFKFKNEYSVKSNYISEIKYRNRDFFVVTPLLKLHYGIQCDEFVKGKKEYYFHILFNDDENLEKFSYFISTVEDYTTNKVIDKECKEDWSFRNSTKMNLMMKIKINPQCEVFDKDKNPQKLIDVKENDLIYALIKLKHVWHRNDIQCYGITWECLQIVYWSGKVSLLNIDLKFPSANDSFSQFSQGHQSDEERLSPISTYNYSAPPPPPPPPPPLGGFESKPLILPKKPKSSIKEDNANNVTSALISIIKSGDYKLKKTEFPQKNTIIKSASVHSLDEILNIRNNLKKTAIVEVVESDF